MEEVALENPTHLSMAAYTKRKWITNAHLDVMEGPWGI